jgi:hypothetical protein
MHHNPNKHSHRDKLKTHHRMFKDLWGFIYGKNTKTRIRRPHTQTW